MTKAWFKSKTVWAGILTMVAGIYNSLPTAFPAIHLPSITNYLPIIFGILGAFGIYGRIDANSKITFSDTQSPN